MAANVSFNPLLVTTAAGSFSTQSEGYIQGIALDDPTVRNALAGGILATAETLPMWGGVGIFENVGYPPVQTAFPQDNLGSLVGRATTTALIQGFSVFNQANAWLTTTQSDAPAAGNLMTVPFYRLGSGARIVVKADPALASLEGGVANAQVSWDCTAQLLQPYQAASGTASVTSITVASGVATATLSGAISGWTLTAGDTVVISGATNSGTAPVALLNTAQKIASVVSSTVFTFNLPTNQGTWGTIGGTILLNYGGGALACKILGLNIGNSMVITYDPVANYVHWDRAGTTAVILI
jgi:hypothetical protein